MLGTKHVASMLCSMLNERCELSRYCVVDISNSVHEVLNFFFSRAKLFGSRNVIQSHHGWNGHIHGPIDAAPCAAGMPSSTGVIQEPHMIVAERHYAAPHASTRKAFRKTKSEKTDAPSAG